MQVKSTATPTIRTKPSFFYQLFAHTPVYRYVYNRSSLDVHNFVSVLTNVLSAGMQFISCAIGLDCESTLPADIDMCSNMSEQGHCTIVY